MAEFVTVRPAILGALLDVVAVALGRVDAVQLDSYERMADFQEWIVAAESALPWRRAHSSKRMRPTGS